MLDDVGEDFLDDAQHMQRVFRRHLRHGGEIADGPDEPDPGLLKTGLQPIAGCRQQQQQIAIARLERVDGELEIVQAVPQDLRRFVGADVAALDHGKGADQG